MSQTNDEAEAFVEAAEQLVEHIVQVMAHTFPDPVENLRSALPR
jgi:hypothetical protein